MNARGIAWGFWVAAAAAAATAACRKKDEPQSESPATDQAEATPSPDPAPPPPSAMFAKGGPALPGELEGLRAGMTKSELEKAGFGLLLALPDGETSVPARYRDASYAPTVRNNRLWRLTVWIDGAWEEGGSRDLLSVLREKWGPEIEVESGGDPAYVWLDPDERLRVWMTRSAFPNPHTKIAFHWYFPAESLFAEDDDAAFLPTPLIGASPDEIEKAYPGELGEYDGQPQLARPPIELEYPPYTAVYMTLRDDRVAGYEMELDYGEQEPVEKRLLSAVEAARGEPKLRGDDLVFPGVPTIVLSPKRHVGRWVMRVGESAR